ncbi:GNAT family N-acetyltransferase [Xanthomonas campestris]|uniref:GNAT family N-acetyltransferase n=1 Tax=Xanthomonas campestris TaxID=339 RepID=UPI0023670673|nr:GNAT family N-acetyltransferase [Xanthomonas campestris]MEA9711960.1 GNAT family N-acetyltransferase [Xanthomonas campestris]MEA9785205.1 GNAT family N-acetyltransferase [Xanthomonas campestris pv. raphani]MEA9793581.1 GNAT family N-acetyltransferase [Xanthomonas campestris pv. raphani]MEA9805114.1 GNAT family N-acetyltransferase [Xanthomonas campestris pv. raphani]MEA9821490.1 GNAT family N-acetyltransferase [Xanthomonas campestris pv. raphani]
MSVTARWCRQLAEIPAGAWDSLHDGAHPFVSHAFLEGMEREGCLRPDWGWQAVHLTLWDGDALVAAAPGYLKNNSHGEFVFDHAWAHAYARYGQDYFPKWLCGVPYSPVTGPRLLGDPRWHTHLLDGMRTLVESASLSSAHVNFYPANEDAAFTAEWLERNDLQYHWHNGTGWADFEAYLAAMNHKHRKNIRQERAKVQRAGVRFRVLHGDEASADELQAMYGFYLKTFEEYGNSPALTPEFLQHLAQHLPRQLVMFLAELDGQPIAGALCLRGGDTLYGRYWGGEALPGLHFETCYYQGIEYCLREGLTRFEPGAQGQHKIARGFLPTLVRSRHWIADPGFREPLAQWCADERAAVAQHAVELAEHSPFRD